MSRCYADTARVAYSSVDRSFNQVSKSAILVKSNNASPKSSSIGRDKVKSRVAFGTAKLTASHQKVLVSVVGREDELQMRSRFDGRSLDDEVRS